MEYVGMTDTQSLLTLCIGMSLSDQYWIGSDA